MFVNVDWFFVSHRLSIATDADKKGIEMSVFADTSNRCPEFHQRGFKFRGSPLRRNTGLCKLGLDFFKTIALIWRGDVEVLHAVTVKPIMVVGLIARVLNLPFVGSVSGLGPAFSGGGLKSSLRRYFIICIYRLIFKNPRSFVIVQTDHDSEVLLENAICKERQLEIIPGSGVDFSKYKMRPSDRSRGSPQSARKLRVLTASRLLRDKGIIEYFQIADLLTRDGWGVEFLLAGPFDHDSPTSLGEDYISEQCRQIGVEYLGNVEDMPALLSTVDLFLYLSYYPEGLPKILLEVAAAGVPVITTNHPGCRDAVVNGRSGLIVEPRDSTGLEKACVNLLSDNRLRRKMSQFSVAHARAHFDVKKVVDAHIRLYRLLGAANF